MSKQKDNKKFTSLTSPEEGFNISAEELERMNAQYGFDATGEGTSQLPLIAELPPRVATPRPVFSEPGSSSDEESILPGESASQVGASVIANRYQLSAESAARVQQIFSGARVAPISMQSRSPSHGYRTSFAINPELSTSPQRTREGSTVGKGFQQTPSDIIIMNHLREKNTLIEELTAELRQLRSEFDKEKRASNAIIQRLTRRVTLLETGVSPQEAEAITEAPIVSRRETTKKRKGKKPAGNF